MESLWIPSTIRYPPQNAYYTPQHHYAPPPSSNYRSRTSRQGHKIVKYSRIDDNYQTLDQVTAALHKLALSPLTLLLVLISQRATNGQVQGHSPQKFASHWEWPKSL
ncbi:hypothetical protein F3Y22_tig00110206pilonHSYRG00012 [Hibiscus syriacus]|uniref:Uncharacterized protein n=1 Tax=Hibiscus syriacus TaxID=106335 RepID=A0A6A3BEN3_HIBSY|nr:E3 ubiquitin-protein ligase RGLG5-like [Hibiscus syriacus]XP_039072086.1 E3 ubiquitin-protein ligase RGLG5-like [Hibiscus syriacus]XP_039072087.1 E3 ubiquitin-protein ligase RGLG5-like [Hibiscus syriacus]KAE8713502.1 hypothetical protein F3Y22_tig00110206pilonHSYRG00012 [Hibiscus syriacus]